MVRTVTFPKAQGDSPPADGSTRGTIKLFGSPQFHHDYRGAIENFIGTAQVPVGLTAPLAVHGNYARGDYRVPLATTEAALVASYSRGAKAITDAGGCTSLLLQEAIARAPAFVFENLRAAFAFAEWVGAHAAAIRVAAEATTRHGRLIGQEATIEGNHVFLTLSFTTAEASGQNIVTKATEAVLAYVENFSPIRPKTAVVDANYSGDKKACARSFTSVRGKRVSADVVLPAAIVEKRLHVGVEQLVECARLAAMGGVLSGAIGTQGHVANGLAALYIATGQDAACVAESAVGVTRFDLTDGGDLYASVTLPSLMLGTVGGGTDLPTQRACLELMRLGGPDSARALAEICGALCLAGEISIAAAMSGGYFARAHRLLGRRAARRKQGAGNAS
jgi:hydroxymethylglutaryl-CoA reductase (NADPH)